MNPAIGLDVYQLTDFPLFQVKDYLDGLIENGGKRIRIFWDRVWPMGISGAGWRNSIFKQVGWWQDAGGPYDGWIFPLFTIAYSDEYGEPWNEKVILKIREILTLAAERGIHVDNSILDGCSMKNYPDNPTQTRCQPLLQNIQHHGAEEGIGREYEKMDGSTGYGHAEHTGGIYGGFGGDFGSMKAIQTVIVAKVVETLNSIPGLSWRVNPGNEMARRREGDETAEYADSILYDWHDFWIQSLKGHGVPEEKIFVSITGDNSRERVSLRLKAKYPGISEQIHGPNSPGTLAFFRGLYPGAELDGDGFDAEAVGHTNEYGFTMPSIEQCRSMRGYMIDQGIPFYHTFNGYIEGPGWQDITKAKWGELRALAGKGDEPEPQPEPEPEPQPEPQPEPPTPPDSRTCFEKYIKGRPIWNWNIRRFLKCLFR